MIWHPKVMASLSKFDKEEVSSTLPENLPLLDDMRRAFPDPEPFVDLDVLFIQHHLGPFVPRLKAMFASGLEPERCWFVDIPYSTNTFARASLIEGGCPKEQATRLFSDPLEDYSTSQSWRVAFLLQKLANRKNPGHLLVIDDGAYFMRYLSSIRMHQPDLLEAFANTRIVEQTTRGHRYLTETGTEIINLCKLSVVSIARCRTKLEFEGPFIGAAVSRALTGSIGNERLSTIQKIGVIGYGVVGRATVAALLRKTDRATIEIVDTDARARKEAAKAGLNCKSSSRLRDSSGYDLVVGCTGYNSFKLDQRMLLANGAILASGSSAAVEFNRAAFIELADRYPDDEIEILNREKTKQQGIHATISIRQEGGRTFSFLNAGFPVNFDGRLECLPIRAIQATHCLLYSAACQVLKQESPGLRPINPASDNWIYEHALKQL